MKLHFGCCDTKRGKMCHAVALQWCRPGQLAVTLTRAMAAEGKEMHLRIYNRQASITDWTEGRGRARCHGL